MAHHPLAVDEFDRLAERFLDFSRAFRTAAPLYGRFAARVARERDVLRLMTNAEPSQRVPVLLFASVHFLLLGDPSHDLASHYPNLRRDSLDRVVTGDEIDDAFIRFVLDHEIEMTQLLATRSTQTNEVGRCNWLLFPFALLEREVGNLARVDVGSSAGLTLLFSDIDFVVQPGGLLGRRGALTLECRTRGLPPQLDHVPSVIWSTGFDTRPVDLSDDAHIRWLEACVWPEQIERFDRFGRAVELARRRGIRVDVGDAVSDIVDFLIRASDHGHPVVTTSWVLNYLTPDARKSFIDRLDEFGAGTDLSWVIAESPRETPELPVDGDPSEDITVISLVTWRAGSRESVRLATTHPHGDWINWGS